MIRADPLREEASACVPDTAANLSREDQPSGPASASGNSCPLPRASARYSCSITSEIPSAFGSCRMAMLSGGSIRFSTADFRSGEYPHPSSCPGHPRNRGKTEQRTTSLPDTWRASSAPVQRCATPGMIAQHSPAPRQMLARKTRNAGQVKPETGKPPDPSGSTQNPKPAPLKSETPHEIGGQLVLQTSHPGYPHTPLFCLAHALRRTVSKKTGVSTSRKRTV